MVELLLEQPRPVGELVERLSLSQPGTSKHLRVLREAGLVSVEQAGRQRVYRLPPHPDPRPAPAGRPGRRRVSRLEPQPIAELDAWLAPYRRLWGDSLDALGRHLDST